MKKVAIILTMTLIISIVGFGASTGRLVNEITATSEPVILREDVTVANKIYISSDIPLQIKPSSGVARIEIYSKMHGIGETIPTSSIRSEMIDDTAYIYIEKDNREAMTINIGELEEYATLYLPKADYEMLTVESNPSSSSGFFYSNYWTTYDMDFRGIDVKKLNLDVSKGRVLLDGMYEEVVVKNYMGEVQVKSMYPMDLLISGYNVDVDLVGRYGTIDLENEGRVDINAIEGQRLIIGGEGNRYHDANNVKVEGPFESVDITRSAQEVELINTVVPIRMNFSGNIDKMKVQLPSDISGFQATVTGIQQEETVIHTEFPVEIEEKSMTSSRMIYGDSSTNILIDDFKGEFYLLQGIETTGW